MSEFTKENYIEHIKSLKTDVWKGLREQEKIDTLQWIADYYAHIIGLPSVCKVKFDRLDGGPENGRFERKTKELIIEEELAIRCLKPPYHDKECNSRDNVLAGKAVLETLAHEFVHAVQQYVLEHSEQFKASDQWAMIMLNIDGNEGNNIRSYFVINGNNALTQTQTSLLYAIQPQERQAFEFATDKGKEFNNIMHNLYPDDVEFCMYESVFKFWDRVEEAKIMFNTETPFEDVDNIIRLNNGMQPTKPINKEMLRVIMETQQIKPKKVPVVKKNEQLVTRPFRRVAGKVFNANNSSSPSKKLDLNDIKRDFDERDRK